MLCLCIPAFAGHNVAGGWCECGSTPDCFCDPGEQPRRSRVNEPGQVFDEPVSQQLPADLGSETLFLLAALLVVLRLKA